MTTRWHSVLSAFQETVRRHPHCVALHINGTKEIRYRDLIDRVASLGNHLRTLGAGHEVVVGLVLPRSTEFVEWLLACWWAGAAFVPIDPTWPEARQNFILRDAGVRLVIDQSRGPLPEPCQPATLQPENLAYVIYTSGTTGHPRGVMVEHRGLSGVLLSQIKAFDLRPGDRSLWLLNPAFDASLSDIGTALLAGATICIEPEDDLKSIHGLVRLLDERAISHIDLPPAYLGLLDPQQMPSGLRTVIIGGESASVSRVRRWASRVRIVNVYGPTESTICTSLCPCDPDTWTEPLLGQPIAGMRYHVMDPQLAPVALGESGELYLEGDGLARGYINQPERTAQRFISLDGRRLYRTGDRVRLRNDGEFVFLGRSDRQVKVHGRLVEPEEIEARFAEHPLVRESAVVKRRTGTGERMVAFVSSQSGDLTSGSLRQHLATTLPAWMIPGRMVLLDRLPRTSSGKIDYSQLIEMPFPTRAKEAEAYKPTTPESQLFANLCQDLLGVEPIDWQASFLAQGGDSLLLVQLVAAAAARGLVIPPALLAGELSLAEVASWLSTQPDDDAVPPGTCSADALRRDVELLVDTLPGATLTTRACCPGSILLTGGTGFLGSYLLRELLLHTEQEVICLVRAANPIVGRSRLQEANPALDARRVRVVVGDVGRPSLGMDRSTWDDLASRVDTVVHSAARVNLVESYLALRSDNVLGTAEIVKLACACRLKTLHYVSTLSVFVATDQDQGMLLEQDDLRHTRWVHGGYAQSKWAAEWLVRRAAAPGARTVIYRPGLITGDSRTGKSARSDFLTLFIRGIVCLGCVPIVNADEMFLDVTTVDYAARALVRLALCASGSEGVETFHLAGAGRLSLRMLLDALSKQGFPINEVELSTWNERVTELQRTHPESAAACLALCRGVPDRFRRHRTMDLFQASGVIFDGRHTQEILADTDIVCPLPTATLIARYIEQALSCP
jgi:amino acid adenylation domain-containing protein/thioester reductase-like protein